MFSLWEEDSGKEIAPRYTGSTADVLSVAVSLDSKRLAAGDKDGGVYIWNTGTKEPSATGRGHKGRVNGIEFTLDGSRVVSAGEDGTVRVWEAATGKELAQFKHNGPVYALAMSPGGKQVLTGGADKTIRLWQLPP